MTSATRPIDLRFEQSFVGGHSVLFEDERDRRWGWRVVGPDRDLPERPLKLAEALRVIPVDRSEEAVAVHLTALRQACAEMALLSDELEADAALARPPGAELLYGVAFHAGQAHRLANELMVI